MGVMLGTAIISGATSMYGAKKAGDAAKQGHKAAQSAAQRGIDAFESVKIPTIEEQQIILQTPELMGQYTPEQISAMQMSVDGIETLGPQDSTVKAQQSALDEISEMAEGGLTEADMAARRQIERDVNQSSRARQKSILNEMAQRGTLGSGMELAAQLKGNQQAMAAEAEASDRLLQQVENARRAALSQKANMAGQMRGQETAEGSDKLKAQKEIERFNLGLRHQDAAERNRAQMINLQAKQSQEDLRAANVNRMEQHNKGLSQTQFQNQMQQASGVAGQYRAQGQAAQAAANAEAQKQAGMAGSIANLAGTIGSHYMKTEKDKN